MSTPTPTPGRPVLVLCGGTDSVKHVRHTFATLTRPSSASTRSSWRCEPKSPPSTRRLPGQAVHLRTQL